MLIDAVRYLWLFRTDTALWQCTFAGPQRDCERALANAHGLGLVNGVAGNPPKPPAQGRPGTDGDILGPEAFGVSRVSLEMLESGRGVAATPRDPLDRAIVESLIRARFSKEPDCVVRRSSDGLTVWVERSGR